VKIRVFVFESFDVPNFFFNLIGESVEKIWLRFSDPWCQPWVVSPGMSLMAFVMTTRKVGTTIMKVVAILKIIFQIIILETRRIQKVFTCNNRFKIDGITASSRNLSRHFFKMDNISQNASNIA
jgi:hypothetical protein